MATKTLDLTASISGHVWLYQGKRRQTWCARWRDHTGQHEKRLGQAWTGRGRPPQGFLRRRDAEALLEEILVDTRRGQLRQQHTGVTFANVAEDWYARGPLTRDWSASTQRDYRSVLDAHLLPKFGSRRIETITPEEFEQWRNQLAKGGKRSRKTVNKIATQAHAIFQHAVERFGLAVNVTSQVRRLRESGDPGRFDFFSPQEVDLLVATASRGAHRDPGRSAVSEAEQVLSAEEDRQDGVIYLAAALAGLRRSELLALLWEDVDFEHSSIRVYEGYTAKMTGRTKSQVADRADGRATCRRAERAKESRASHRQARPRLRQPLRDPARWLCAAPALPRRARCRRTAPAALPRSAPHLR